jgi:hypothetical protein
MLLFYLVFPGKNGYNKNNTGVPPGGNDQMG